MNIDRFKYFQSLSKTLNFTETAEQFYTTQGNVSKQIINLEKELDTTLFIREHRSISLSPAGRALLPYVSKLLEDYSNLEHALLPYQNSKNTTLRISGIPVMMNYNITEIISKFHNMYPNTQLHIKEMESINLLKSVDEGQCDIAYMRIFELNLEKYEKITVEYDSFVAVLPKNHPLAQKKQINLSELSKEHFYQLDNYTQLYQQFSILCSQAQFKPTVAYTGTHLQNILDFISKGMGVSLVMENSFNHTLHPDIVCVPLDTTIQSELAFIRHRNSHHTPISQQFWNFIIKNIER